MAGYLTESVQNRNAPGYVAMVSRHGRLAMTASIGWRDIDRNLPMTPTTRFRIASMTKPVTATAIMHLVEEGRIQLLDPVSRFLPAFSKPMVWDGVNGESHVLRTAKRQITILDLLSNRSGMGYANDMASDLGKIWAEVHPDANDTATDFVNRLANLPLYFEPGTDFLYSYGYDVLGAVIETVENASLDEVFQRLIFTPLHMNVTGFPGMERDDELAQLYQRAENGALIPSGKSQAQPPAKYFSGGAGLISTAPDFMHFAQMLANRGQFKTMRVLSAASVDMMSRNRQGPGDLERRFGPTYAGVGYGLGVSVVEDPGKTAYLSHLGDYAWGGSYDTQWIVSPSTGLVATLFTQVDPINRSYPKRTYEDFRDLLYACIDDPLDHLENYKTH
jgi:CubicO group peptidase (beta-lactamase class C family)